MFSDVYGWKYYTVKLLGKRKTALIRLAGDENTRNQQPAKNLQVIKYFPVDDYDFDEKNHALENFRRLTQLRHPFLLQYFTSFLETDHLIVLSEYCEGESLSSYLKKQKEDGKSMEEEQVGVWTLQLVMALHFLHNNEYLHGNIKTSNIFVKNGYLKLGGLEQLRLPASSSKLYDPFLKTFYYLSPEVWKEGNYTSKADIWSLGMVLYEMCTYEHALNGIGLIRVLWQSIQQTCPQLPPSYSTDLQNLINAMLAKTPENRPTTLDLLQFPFLKRQLFNMHRRLKLASITISGVPIEQQLQEMQSIWNFPPESDNENINLTETVPQVPEAIQTPEKNSGESVVGDPSEANETNSSEADHPTENVETMMESSTTADDTTPLHERSNTITEDINQAEEVRAYVKQPLLLPEERILQEIYSLARKFLGPKTDDSESEDQVWPDTATVHDKLFPMDHILSRKNMIHKSQETMGSRSPELQKDDSAQAVNDQHVCAQVALDEMEKFPQYWKLYTEARLIECTTGRVGSTSKTEQSLIGPEHGNNSVEDLQQSSSDRIEPNSNLDMLMDLTNKPMTICEPSLEDIKLAKLTIPSLKQVPEEAKENELIIVPNHSQAETESSATFHGDETLQGQILPTESPEGVRTEQALDVENICELTEERTISLCKEDLSEYLVPSQYKEPELPCAIRPFDAQQLRKMCVNKLGPELLSRAYTFLVTKRIDEKNAAEELTIVNGLRSILKEAPIGFAVEQLVLLEYMRNM